MKDYLIWNFSKCVIFLLLTVESLLLYVHTSLTSGKPQPEIKGTEIFPISTVADS